MRRRNFLTTLIGVGVGTTIGAASATVLSVLVPGGAATASAQGLTSKPGLAREGTIMMKRSSHMPMQMKIEAKSVLGIRWFLRKLSNKIGATKLQKTIVQK